MPARDVLWTLPLTVTLPSGLERTFSNVYEAALFLENEWPLKRGMRYDRAVSACRRALNQMTPLAVAREVFIAACLEANVPVAMAAIRSPAVGASSRARPASHLEVGFEKRLV
jgi:hypothetical protein